MTSEIVKLTTEIVVSHVSMTELTPDQLVDEIKAVYNVLGFSGRWGNWGEIQLVPGSRGCPGLKNQLIPLKDIVKAKYVVCLECGKKMRTLKAHIRKTHGLMPKEYYQRFGLDPKKFPLVCKEYSEQRSKMAKDRGFGVKGGGRKTTT